MVSGGDPTLAPARMAEELPAADALAWNLQQELKDLLELIGTICESHECQVHLLDAERQTLADCPGQSLLNMPLALCFCSHAVCQDSPFVVADLREDPRFRDHVSVTSEPYRRFYAGYPLTASSGEKIGALCLSSSVPRQLTSLQQKTLSVLSRQVAVHLETRKQLSALNAADQGRSRYLRELEISDSRFRAFLNSSPVSAFIKDEDGRMVYCNQALAERFGATPEEWIGKTDFETWPREVAEQFQKTDQNVLQQNREFHYEDRTDRPDGRSVIWDVHKYPFVDASGHRSVACMALDVTSRCEAQQQLQQTQRELQIAIEKLHILSRTDALTGLINRRALEDCLEIEWNASVQSSTPLSLLMLDVDDFKGFNDSFGHVHGDEVLRRISSLMRQWTRQSDMIARYGGEEFLLILPNTGAIEAFQIAERLREAIAAAVWEQRSITVSIGIASRTECACTATRLVHQADEALYAAKHRGKNRVFPENGVFENFESEKPSPSRIED
jgi:diguanylate cyclase (GGDEF)-like protein/PAS domain S-box-containing protein